MVEILRRAGNLVEPEVKVDNELHPKYPFRVDYVINQEVAVEIQGIGFGHHSFGAIQKTYRKHNAIAAKGWLLLQITRADIASGDALEVLSRVGVKVQA